MPPQNEVVSLTPKEFEIQVEKLLRGMSASLSDFQVQRLEKVEGLDGVYEIDVTVRFEALGANFLVLAECKHYKNPVKREVVQVLRDKLHSIGAQKGIIFSTAYFQRGAIDYAKAHGIALVKVADGRTSYIAKSYGAAPLPAWVPPYVGWVVTPYNDDEGDEESVDCGMQSLICHSNEHLLQDWLSDPDSG